MIKMSIRHNFKDVARQMDKMADDVSRKVMVRALNKTIDQGKKQMASEISKEFMVTRKQAEDRLHVTRCTLRNELQMFVSLESLNKRSAASGRSMNLIHFVEKKVSMAEAKRRRKGGTLNQLRVKIKRQGGAKILRNAFIATNKKTGGTAVFMRAGKDRMPIEAKSTIDIPSMFNTRRINEAVRKIMLARFESNFKRELRAVQQVWKK